MGRGADVESASGPIVVGERSSSGHSTEQYWSQAKAIVLRTLSYIASPSEKGSYARGGLRWGLPRLEGGEVESRGREQIAREKDKTTFGENCIFLRCDLAFIKSSLPLL